MSFVGGLTEYYVNFEDPIQLFSGRVEGTFTSSDVIRVSCIQAESLFVFKVNSILCTVWQ